ncbi:hypothetical protein Tco_0741559, partial [Tanacetum coccineum]
VREDVPDHDISDRAVEGHRIDGVDLEVTTITERISICRTMSTATRSEMTQEAINELIAKHVEEALKAYDVAKNPRTKTEMENEQQDNNVEANVNNGNGNGNGNGNPNVNNKGTILATIPSTAPTIDSPVIHDDTLLIPTDTPTISPIVPTIPPVAPTIQYTSPFICTDSSDYDTPNTPPSLNPYEILPAPHGLPHRLVVLVLPGQPIPVGRPYRTQPNGVLKMLTTRKSVGSLHTHRLALRYLADYSLSDLFTSDDTSQVSLSDSSLETSSDSHSDASSDSSSRHTSSCYAILDSPCNSPTTTFAGPSRKRCRSPTSSVPVDSPVHRALSPVHANLLPPPMRIRDSDSVTDFEVSLEEGYVPYVPREVGLGVDVEDSYEPYTEPNVNSDIQVNIDECITFIIAIRARGMNVRDVVETAANRKLNLVQEAHLRLRFTRGPGDDDVHEPVREDVPDHDISDRAVEVSYETLGDLVQRFHDHSMEIPTHQIHVIESVQRF